MDKTALVREVSEIFRLNGHSVETSVRIGFREIDVVARELQGIFHKIILIECADYDKPVGVDKIQEDMRKLQAAREEMSESVLLAHISRNGYSPDAAGYAMHNGISILSLSNLTANLINFDNYINIVEQDKLYPIIIKEYQSTSISPEGKLRSLRRQPAIDFLDTWISETSNYLILLGDYGVGKSWLLRRYLYLLLERYKSDRERYPMPFLVPLQRFTKAFDFPNLILKSFETYGLAGAHYAAFLHLTKSGRIVLLLDSFDEMAQHLSRVTIRENLTALFEVASPTSKIIMTSRPNYF